MWGTNIGRYALKVKKKNGCHGNNFWHLFMKLHIVKFFSDINCRNLVRIGDKLWLWEDFLFGWTDKRCMFLYPPSMLLTGDRNGNSGHLVFHDPKSKTIQGSFLSNLAKICTVVYSCAVNKKLVNTLTQRQQKQALYFAKFCRVINTGMGMNGFFINARLIEVIYPQWKSIQFSVFLDTKIIYS